MIFVDVDGKVHQNAITLVMLRHDHVNLRHTHQAGQETLLLPVSI